MCGGGVAHACVCPRVWARAHAQASLPCAASRREMCSQGTTSGPLPMPCFVGLSQQSVHPNAPHNRVCTSQQSVHPARNPGTPVGHSCSSTTSTSSGRSSSLQLARCPHPSVCVHAPVAATRASRRPGPAAENASADHALPGSPHMLHLPRPSPRSNSAAHSPRLLRAALAGSRKASVHPTCSSPLPAGASLRVLWGCVQLHTRVRMHTRWVCVHVCAGGHVYVCCALARTHVCCSWLALPVCMALAVPRPAVALNRSQPACSQLACPMPPVSGLHLRCAPVASISGAPPCPSTRPRPAPHHPIIIFTLTSHAPHPHPYA